MTRTFFDFAVDSLPIGRVVFELFIDETPKTCENFRALCTGEKGISSSSERPLYYKDSIIHRSITDFMIQGGDFTKRNGMGGESIYGNPFADEDLSRKLDSEGLLCMANKGPNTNGSQFFVTLRACPHLNGKHVVFGRVIRGYDVIQKISEVSVDDKDRPTVPVVISKCGELELRKAPQQHENGTKAKQSESNSKANVNSDSDNDKKSKSKSKGSSKRHRRHSVSQHDDEDSEGSESRSRRHRKRKKDRKENEESSLPRPAVAVEERKETEEEYDARLEREEKERLEAEKKKHLEYVKSRYREEQTNQNGVRFKGRGRMKFIDPELQRRQMNR